VHPGLAERIVCLAEAPYELAKAQQAHRHELERMTIRSDIRVRWVGLGLGFAIVVAILIIGVWLTITGNSLAGLTAILGTTATLVGVFVYTDRQKRQERNQKLADVLEA
jgi:uncharacterized membrane protein